MGTRLCNLVLMTSTRHNGGPKDWHTMNSTIATPAGVVIAQQRHIDISGDDSPAAARYTLELGFIRDGAETIDKTETFDGVPRNGAFEKITPAAFISSEYAELGITHLVERITINSGVAITITHTHESGTLIEGTSKGDGSADALKASGWRWSRGMGAWFVPMSRDRAPKTHVIERTAAALTAAGFDVVQDIDRTARTTAEVEAGRIERQADRVDALDAKAERKQAAEDQAHDNAIAALNRLPEGGEPVKIGHHSEGRHRNAIDKAERAMRKSVEAGDVAREAARRAESAAHTTDARYSPITVANRIKKLGADIRDRERKLAGYRNNLGDVFSPATGGYAERLTEQLVELRDSLGYWEGVRAGQVAAGVATNYGPESINKGDFVYAWHGWREVARVNAKSVTVLVPMNGTYTAKHTAPYADLKGHRAAVTATA